MSNVGLGFVAVSNDLGESWTTTTPFSPIIYNLPVTVVPGTSFDLPFAPVHGIAIRRNGYRLFRDDSGGIDFGISGRTVTLAIPLQNGEVIIVDSTIGGTFGGSLTPSIGTALSGAFNDGTQTATVATGASTTSFTSATAFVVGTIFLFTGGTVGNIGKTCYVSARSGSGPYTYTVDGTHDCTGLSSTPAASDAFSVAFTLPHTPTGGVELILSGVTLVQGGDWMLVDNAVQYITVAPETTGFWHLADFVYA